MTDHGGVMGCSVKREGSGAMGDVSRGEAAMQLMTGGDATVCLYFICTWAWVRFIGERRWITLIIE